MDGSSPLKDEQAFRQNFKTGLEDIAEADTLGAFILALANASQNQSLWQTLLPRLLQRRDVLAQQYHSILSASESDGVGGINPADLVVFRQIMQLSLQDIGTTRYRQLGPWLIQNNPLRALRPNRMGNQTPNSLYIPFNADGFHFDRSFMAAERFCRDQLEGLDVNLYYNKFPFVDGHLLLVVNKTQHWPQYHRQEIHHLLWTLCLSFSSWHSHAGIAYNSIGAYASVNHLHYQMYVREQGLAIESLHWRHNGGDMDYPLECQVYQDLDTSWDIIEELHKNNHAYNLLYVPGRVYVIPRQRQGSYPGACWSPGFAWYETCGGFVVEDRDAFTQLQETDIEQALLQLRSVSSQSGSRGPGV